ncbi:MAG: hypothetical protein ABI348_02485 [Nitrososphaera sp.]|jgi:hypothetical protein
MEVDYTGVAVMSALEVALDSLGEDSKRVVLYHMAERCGIRAGSSRVSLLEVETALESLFGPAAGIITVLVRKKLVSGGATA